MARDPASQAGPGRRWAPRARGAGAAVDWTSVAWRMAARPRRGRPGGRSRQADCVLLARRRRSGRRHERHDDRRTPIRMLSRFSDPGSAALRTRPSDPGGLSEVRCGASQRVKRSKAPSVHRGNEPGRCARLHRVTRGGRSRRMAGRAVGAPHAWAIPQAGRGARRRYRAAAGAGIPPWNPGPPCGVLEFRMCRVTSDEGVRRPFGPLP